MNRLLLVLIAVCCTGCATSTLYSRGVKVAVLQGDLTGSTFHYAADGSIDWTVARVSHSTATRAGGSVVGTAGSAVAASGILTLLK